MIFITVVVLAYSDNDAVYAAENYGFCSYCFWWTFNISHSGSSEYARRFGGVSAVFGWLRE